MPFDCPECGVPGTLAITAAIELPPDRRSDEIALQLVACARCGFRAVAVYEESRRGSLDSEAVDHAGCRVPAETLDAIASQIAACPDPGNPACACASHRRLGRADDSGRWCGLPEMAGRFPMRVSPAR
ncbi:MAG: hypothetical protein ACJ8GN_14805 [Longimicrobiaceae bacterium]